MAPESPKNIHYFTIQSLYTLSDKDRDETLRQHLTQKDPVVIHPYFEPTTFNKDITSGLLLLQTPFTSTDDIDCRLIQQAREIFYGTNTFLVWWDGLHEFMSGFSIGENVSSVESMVRSIVVRYDMRDKAEHERSLMVELEKLFRFEKVRQLTLEIVGGGTRDGSDLETQSLIKELSMIVQRLIAHFGDCFSIQKGLGGYSLLPSPTARNLAPLWISPQSSTKEKVRRSQATFEEYMQVQIASYLSGEGEEDLHQEEGLLAEASGPEAEHKTMARNYSWFQNLQGPETWETLFEAHKPSMN